MNRRICLGLAIIACLLTSCTFNPFSPNNALTGNAAGPIIGGAAGAGVAAAAGATKPIVGLSGLLGASLGYYVTTLRFASAGILKSCGQVYTIGDYLGIEIPTDRLFDVNSADFLEDADVALNSIVAVLERYPNHNILISGNMSGFSSDKFELKLSEARASQVAGYLWAHGINSFKCNGMTMRKLVYVGYGNYFPISNTIHNNSIRENSRIQITAYPSFASLELDTCHRVFHNIGAMGDERIQCRSGDFDYLDTGFSQVLNETSNSQNSDFTDIFSECAVKNTCKNYTRAKDDDVWGCYAPMLKG